MKKSNKKVENEVNNKKKRNYDRGQIFVKIIAAMLVVMMLLAATTTLIFALI